jgi:hypothetical protein
VALHGFLVAYTGALQMVQLLLAMPVGQKKLPISHGEQTVSDDVVHCEEI